MRHKDPKLMRKIHDFAEEYYFSEGYMKRCNITSEELMERSGLGSTTITKLRTGKGRPKLETILAFCVALNLEEYFRTDLMNKAGVRFDNNNPAHLVYLTILELMPDANVFQIHRVGKCPRCILLRRRRGLPLRPRRDLQNCG